MTVSLDGARARAHKIISSYFEGVKEWPVDDWISLSDEWDLNLYLTGTIKCAVIYPVSNGLTNTKSGFRLGIK